MGNITKESILYAKAISTSKCIKCIIPRVKPQAGQLNPLKLVNRQIDLPVSKKSEGSMNKINGIIVRKAKRP